MDAPGDRLALAAFLGGATLAGGNAVCIRFSNRELEPLWGAGLRFALAAAVMLAVMAVLHLELPRGRAVAGAALYGAFAFAGAFALAYYALDRLHAGFAQIVLALVPLATLLLAVLERQERFRMDALVGGLLALAGIAAMSGTALEGSIPVLPVLAVVASAFCFGQAAIVVRGFPQLHPVVMNAVAMTAGAVLLIAAALIAGEPIVLPDRDETWAAIVYLVLIGSVVVFVLYLIVLRYWTASRANYEFVLIPVVTVLLSAWLDDEPVGVGLVAGGLLVIAGVYVGALRRRPSS